MTTKYGFNQVLGPNGTVRYYDREHDRLVGTWYADTDWLVYHPERGDDVSIGRYDPFRLLAGEQALRRHIDAERAARLARDRAELDARNVRHLALLAELRRVLGSASVQR
jgi:hypothetical protein